MQLTDEQAETARSLGCRFVAATEAQVRQFSMQRRVFTIGGASFLAARQDGFYETAGTLLALIAEAMRDRETTPEAAENVPEERLETAPPVAQAAPPMPIDFPVRAVAPATAPVMAATVTIVRGYARRGTLDTEALTALVATVHQTLQRLR